MDGPYFTLTGTCEKPIVRLIICAYEMIITWSIWHWSHLQLEWKLARTHICGRHLLWAVSIFHKWAPLWISWISHERKYHNALLEKKNPYKGHSLFRFHWNRKQKEKRDEVRKGRRRGPRKKKREEDEKKKQDDEEERNTEIEKEMRKKESVEEGGWNHMLLTISNAGSGPMVDNTIRYEQRPHFFLHLRLRRGFWFKCFLKIKKAKI